jgi:integrase
MSKVKKVRAGDRVYYYHRPTGKRITAELGTPAFDAAVRELDATVGPAIASHTLGSLVAAYLASPEFGRLADATKRDYRRVFEYLKPIYPMPLSQVTGAFTLSLRDKAFGQHKRRFANYVVQVLRLLFSWGVPRDFSSINPAMGTPLIRKPKGEVKGNRPWTVEEFYTLLDIAKGGMRVAIALGGYAAVSEGDMLILARQNLRGHVLEFVRKKTGVPVHQTMHSELVEILAALPTATADEPQNLVLNAWGRPFTASGFRASFFKLARKLAADGRVGSKLTFHGLRHFVATEIANQGGDDRMISTVLGQTTHAMAQHYSKEYDRKLRSNEGTALLQTAVHRKK